MCFQSSLMQSILGINLSFIDFVSSPCSIQVVESTRKNVLGYAKVPEMFDTFDRSVRSYYPASFKRQCCNGVARRVLRACVVQLPRFWGWLSQHAITASTGVAQTWRVFFVLFGLFDEEEFWDQGLSSRVIVMLRVANSKGDCSWVTRAQPFRVRTQCSEHDIVGL